MRDHSEFKEFLDQQACKYRRCLEDIFGQCDQRFVFGTIKKSIREDKSPHTQFPNEFHFNGGCSIDIHISEGAWQNCYKDQATWQLAHESVHLLDPVELKTATFLEEGLATWFSDEPKYHHPLVRAYIKGGIKHEPPYDEAKKLVCRCMPQLKSVVKKIRSSGVRIQDITADKLAPCLPNVDRETIERLCSRIWV